MAVCIIADLGRPDQTTVLKYSSFPGTCIPDSRTITEKNLWDFVGDWLIGQELGLQQQQDSTSFIIIASCHQDGKYYSESVIKELVSGHLKINCYIAE